MSWSARQSTIMGPTIVTTDWRDLGRLPQPVFHTDELVLLAAAKTPDAMYAMVADVKRLFRGSWVTYARGPRRIRKRRPMQFGTFRPAYVPDPVLEDDDDA